MMNCRRATRLMSQELERPLGRGERLALRLHLHLLMCSGCSNFRKQMKFLRRACRQRTDDLG